MWFKQGQIEVDSGDESEFGSGECGDECGDGHAKETNPAGIPFPPLPPSLHPFPNQSKPIVPTLSLSLLFSFILVLHNLQLYLHNHQL